MIPIWPPQLIVDIPKYKQLRYISFYTIVLQTTNCTDPAEWSLDKRYNDFFEVNEALRAKNYSGLPLLPAKTYFPVRNQIHLLRRKEDLANYIKSVASRSDILNSKEMIKFLEIDSHAPEVLIRPPKLVEQLDCETHQAEHYYVTHCTLIEKHSLFILCLNDAKRKQNSKLEIYSFSHLGVFRESFTE